MNRVKEPKVIKLYNPDTFEATEKVVPNQYTYKLTSQDRRVLKIIQDILHSSNSYDTDYKYLNDIKRILNDEYYETKDQDLLNDFRSVYGDQIKSKLKKVKS